MKATLLAFNVSPDRLSRLRYFCLMLRVTLTAVPPEDFGRTLNDLCTRSAASAPAPEAPFTDEMLLLAGFSSAQLDTLLGEIRRSSMAPFALKAMLTPANRRWTPVQLHAELTREKAAIGEQQSSRS